MTEIADQLFATSRQGGQRVRPILLLLVVSCIVLALDILLLPEIPYTATLDDGLYAEEGFSFVHTGRTGWPTVKGLFDLDRDTISHGRIAAALVGGSQWALGTTTAAARLPGLLSVVLSVGLVFVLARQCAFSVPVSLAGSLLWFLSVGARELGHSARPDALLMLFVLCTALLLFRGLMAGSDRLFLLAGLTSGLSLEAHMAGSCVILTFGICAFLFSVPARRLRNAALFGLGVVPPVILWLWVHRFSQPELWRVQWEGFWRYWGPAPILDGPSAVIRSTFVRYGKYFWGARYHRYLFEAPFILIAIVAGLRRNDYGRLLATAFVMFHLCLALLIVAPHAGYMAAAYPLACVLIAARFFTPSHRALRLTGAALVAFYLAQTAYWAINRETPLPARVRSDVLRVVGDKPFLAGDHLWFHFWRDENMRSIVTVALVRPSSPHQSWSDVFETYLLRERIEFVVLDRVAQGLLTPSQMEFFNRNSTLAQQYDYGHGKWVKIYKLSPLRAPAILTPH